VVAAMTNRLTLILVGYRRSINSELKIPEHAGFQCF
jgi:hypothetical protein